MALEGVEVRCPKAPEGLEPGVELHQRLGAKAIDAPLRLDARLDEARLSQHAQVLRYGRLRDVEVALELADGLFLRCQKLQNGSAIRLGSAMIVNVDSI